MSCAACQAHVEKAVSSVAGVDSCSVSLLTNSMSVTGSADEAAIIKAVEDAGYGASREGVSPGSNTFKSMEDQLENKEIPVLRKRLISSLVFLAALMYLSMGISMWNWPAPPVLKDNMTGIAITEMLISGIIMVFIPSISEFAIADILGGSKILLIGNVIEQEFNLTNNWNLGSGLSLVLMLFIFVSMAVMNKTDADQEAQLLW